MRPDVDSYFMEMAQVVAKRATCDRKTVGAIITIDRHIITTGYNGAPSGSQHCLDVGHVLSVIDGDETCVRTVHAEVNAITIAAKYGRSVNGGTMYVTHCPCERCVQTMLTAGISRLVFQTETRNNGGLAMWFNAGKTYSQHPPF